MFLGGHHPTLDVGFFVRPLSICPRKLLVKTYIVHDDNDDDEEEEGDDEEEKGREGEEEQMGEDV